MPKKTFVRKNYLVPIAVQIIFAQVNLFLTCSLDSNGFFTVFRNFTS